MNKRVRDMNRALTGCALGWPLLLLDEVVSTNDILKQLADVGAGEGCAVVAEAQTKGRGRMGRSWLSSRGKGLYLSVLLRPGWPVSESSAFSLFSALAVARVLKRAGLSDISLKWPNDVMVNGSKIAGILVEPRTRKGIIEYCVIGIGINLSHTAQELEATGAPAATSCRNEGVAAERDEILVGVLKEMQNCYKRASSNRTWLDAEWADWSVAPRKARK